MIQIITGAPCSGKSTYIAEHAKEGDIIIDLDKIALALSPKQTPEFDYSQKTRWVAVMARKAAIKEAIYQAQGDRYMTVWIVHTDPTADERQAYRAMNGRIIEMQTTREICLERLKQRPTSSQPFALKGIDEYFAKR